MGYQIIDPDSIEPTPERPCVHRAISDAGSFEQVAINYYEAEPGEQLPLAYHYHDDQELAVETPDEEFLVETGECFLADPGSPHRAYNAPRATHKDCCNCLPVIAGTGQQSPVRDYNSPYQPVTVLAIGAPRVEDAHPYEK